MRTEGLLRELSGHLGSDRFVGEVLLAEAAIVTDSHDCSDQISSLVYLVVVHQCEHILTDTVDMSEIVKRVVIGMELHEIACLCDLLIDLCDK